MRTKLERFMKANDITVAQLAELSERSERHIVYLRQGASPHLQSALDVLRGCRKATGRLVSLSEIFDIEPIRSRATSQRAKGEGATGRKRNAS